MTQPSPPIITPAATVIVLRQAQTVQVLMTQRHANLSFMGGMWVFPGGSLSACDHATAELGLISDPAAFCCQQMLDLHARPLPRKECLALAIAACRETFEESGLLLARYHDGTPCDPNLVAALQSERTAVVGNPAHFNELLQREQLQLDVASLSCWSHWITPSAVSRRFDTHFFVIGAPAEQSASTDSREVTQHCWRSPAELLAANERGEMSLPHPTACTLIELDTHLQRYGSLAALLKGERLRPLPPILPKILQLDGQRSVLMPWDSDYHSSSGEGTPPGLDFPAALLALRSRAPNMHG